MNINIPKSNLFSLIFIFLYIFNIFLINISNSQYFVVLHDMDVYVDRLKLVIYVLLIFSVLFFYRVNKFTLFDLLLTLIFLVSYYYSRLGIAVFLFFICARYVRFDLVLKGFISAVLLGAIFVFFTYLFDLYEYSVSDFSRNVESIGYEIYRYSLGYKFPTYLPNALLYVVFSWIALRKENITFIEFLVIFVLNYIIYDFTDTRTIFYLINLLLFVLFIIKTLKIDYKTPFLGRVARFFTIYSFLLLSSLSICLHIFYDPNIEWMSYLNKLLSGRLSHGYYGYSEYGFSLFGQKIDYVDFLDVDKTSKLFVIDSGYLKVLIDQGWILFTIITIGFFYIGKKIVSKNNIYMGGVLVFMLLDIVVNPHLLLLSFNPFLFLLSYYAEETNLKI